MKEIQLKDRCLGRYADASPFPLGNLRLQFYGVPKHSAEFRFTAFMNGTKCAYAHIFKDGDIVEVPQSKLCAGEFTCYVSAYLNGTEIKRYLIERLIIFEPDTGMTGYPELDEIKKSIQKSSVAADTALKSAVRDNAEALRKQHQELEEQNRTLRSMVVALVRFAFEDYKSSVYLDGGTFEQFADKYGFAQLSAQEISIIKGDSNNEDENAK